VIVCLCGSFKFYDKIVGVKELLVKLGINCLEPQPFVYRDKQNPSEFVHQWSSLTHSEKLTSSRKAEKDFLSKIDQADLLYVINPNGYIGLSVTLEIGYACAKKKPIFSMNSIEDYTIMSMISGIIKPQEINEALLERYKD
jgi:nucleoside 2-deoxyribosyltransferase